MGEDTRLGCYWPCIFLQDADGGLRSITVTVGVYLMNAEIIGCYYFMVLYTAMKRLVTAK